MSGRSSPAGGKPAQAREPAPPLEANDQLVTAVITAGWVIALVVLLIVHGDLPQRERWWIWTAVAGLGMGLFGLVYVPRLKRSRARTAQRRAQQADGDQANADQADGDQADADEASSAVADSSQPSPGQP
jgi:hypothetical protein